MIAKEGFREWNEMMVRKYNPEDYIFRSNFLVRFVELMRFKKINNTLQLKSNDEFLDIGCGSGYLLSQAVCGRGVGMDISDLMVKTARKNCMIDGRKFIVQSDAEKLPFKKGVFDKIVSTEVLEHILRPMALLEEIGRVSKSDTVVIVTIPNERLINLVKKIIFSLHIHKLLFRKNYRPSRKMEDEWHLHTFDMRKFKELIKGKFVVKKTIPVPAVFFPIRYIFKLEKAFQNSVKITDVSFS